MLGDPLEIQQSPKNRSSASAAVARVDRSDHVGYWLAGCGETNAKNGVAGRSSISALPAVRPGYLPHDKQSEAEAGGLRTFIRQTPPSQRLEQRMDVLLWYRLTRVRYRKPNVALLADATRRA